MSEQTYWNGEPCTAARVIARVGRAPRPTWWCAKLEGTERAAVYVKYGAEAFLLDDEDGSGWAKVTIGRGSPQWGHSSLPTGSIVLRDREPVASADAPTSTPDGETPQVMLPEICREHQVKLVRRLGLGPDDPWVLAFVTLQLLLFRAAMADEGITKRIDGDASAIALVLAELGCPACARHDDFARAIAVLRKGSSYAARVARGEVYDADFGIPANADAEGQQSDHNCMDYRERVPRGGLLLEVCASCGRVRHETDGGRPMAWYADPSNPTGHRYAYEPSRNDPSKPTPWKFVEGGR